MGCFGLFGRKTRRSSVTEKGDLPRPLHGSFASVEKPLLTSGRSSARPTASLPSTIASLKPTTHPSYSAYAGAADGTAPHDGGLRYRGTDRGDAALTGASHPKQDNLDEPEADERARRAEEARHKAEQEEQERRDFLQWM